MNLQIVNILFRMLFKVPSDEYLPNKVNAAINTCKLFRNEAEPYHTSGFGVSVQVIFKTIAEV